MKVQWQVTAAQHTPTVERAYVKLSHTPPGLNTENTRTDGPNSQKLRGERPERVVRIGLEPKRPAIALPVQE